MLHFLLKVDAGGLADRVSAALGARRWQERACAALQPGARPTGVFIYLFQCVCCPRDWEVSVAETPSRAAAATRFPCMSCIACHADPQHACLPACQARSKHRLCLCRAVDGLTKLLREGLGAGVAEEGQPLTAALTARASAGRAWLQNAHAVLEILQVCDRGCANICTAHCNVSAPGALWRSTHICGLRSCNPLHEASLSCLGRGANSCEAGNSECTCGTSTKYADPLPLCMQGDDASAVVEQGQAIAAAQQLAAEAQTLGVKVDREVEKLREVRSET